MHQIIKTRNLDILISYDLVGNHSE